MGGDWYDVIPLEDDRVMLAVGDVVGHGLSAASLMGQLRNALRALALDGHSPGEVIERLDRLVTLDGTGMATVSCMSLVAGARLDAPRERRPPAAAAGGLRRRGQPSSRAAARCRWA